ncbi:hypothetical protein GCM10023189_29260 [Nibrella saemangeumensis]|uniref:DUF4249 domain-containing protein n=1 Tax=Nibrella saemangeumensis TaxID=1084526 RepID=A0ABP8N1P9_9BACT
MLAGILVSCVDEVQLPIRQEAPKLVVAGLITTAPPPYTVRLSYTGDFQYIGLRPKETLILNATVRIQDDAGRSTRLTTITGQPGYYQTIDTAFVGEIGRTYTLSVTLPDGKQYVSRPERMVPVPAIDTVYSEFISTDNIQNPYRYRVYVDTKDPADQQNFYRWEGLFYSLRPSTGSPCTPFSRDICNDRCWVPVTTRTVNIFSDQLINGNTVQKQPVMESLVFATGPQLFEIRQYSLTREAYQFWKRFGEQQTRVGTIFDPLPAPIQGNMVNAADPGDLALGYFGASAVAVVRSRIQGEETYQPRVQSFLNSIIVPPGDCRLAYAPIGRLFADIPEGWR